MKDKEKEVLIKLFEGHPNSDLMTYYLQEENYVLARADVEDFIQSLTNSLVKTLDEYSIDSHNRIVEKIKALRVFDSILTEMTIPKSEKTEYVTAAN